MVDAVDSKSTIIIRYAGSNPAFGSTTIVPFYYLLWPLQDLNLRPSDYESPALTSELKGLFIYSIQSSRKLRNNSDLLG